MNPLAARRMWVVGGGGGGWVEVATPPNEARFVSAVFETREDEKRFTLRKRVQRDLGVLRNTRSIVVSPAGAIGPGSWIVVDEACRIWNARVHLTLEVTSVGELADWRAFVAENIFVVGVLRRAKEQISSSVGAESRPGPAEQEGVEESIGFRQVEYLPVSFWCGGEKCVGVMRVMSDCSAADWSVVGELTWVGAEWDAGTESVVLERTTSWAVQTNGFSGSVVIGRARRWAQHESGSE